MVTVRSSLSLMPGARRKLEQGRRWALARDPTLLADKPPGEIMHQRRGNVAQRGEIDIALRPPPAALNLHHG